MTETNLPAVQSDSSIAPAPPALRSVPSTATRTRSFFPEPTSPQEAMEFARLIADSDLAPKDYRGKPGNVIIAIEMGREVGLAPMQALSGIAVINGRASMWGDAMIGLIRANAICEFIVEDESGTGDGHGWTCTAKRRGDPNLIVNRFTIADAKRAQLFGKPGPWQQYPERMLKMRARAFTLRDAFPDVLKGLAIREEVEDIEESASVADALAAPTRTEAVKRILGATAPRNVDEVSGKPAPAAPSEYDLAIRGKSLTEIGEYVRAQALDKGVDEDELRRIVAQVPGGKLIRSTAAMVLEIIANRSEQTIEMEENAESIETAAPAIDFAKMTAEQLTDLVDNAAMKLQLPSSSVTIVLRAFAPDGLAAENISAVLAELEKRSGAN